jgi:hypothetical protein
MIPPAKRRGRRREVNIREVLNAIFYVLSTGCQWQALPKDLPPKSTAHSYFMLWDWDGNIGAHPPRTLYCHGRARGPEALAVVSSGVQCQASDYLAEASAFRNFGKRFAPGGPDMITHFARALASILYGLSTPPWSRFPPILLTRRACSLGAVFSLGDVGGDASSFVAERSVLRLDERHVARLYHAYPVEIAPQPFNRPFAGAGAMARSRL